MGLERGTRAASALVALSVLGLFVNGAAAQSWAPERGEGAFTTSYNYISFKGHLGGTGSREPEAASKAQNILFDVDYGLTDRWALSVSLPIVTTRYADTKPPPALLHGLFNQVVQATGPNFYSHQFLDDGSYHSTIEDFQIGVRYQLTTRPVVLTPFVAVVIPSHDYAYVGESAPGRNFREIMFGTTVARRLNPFLRNAYVQSQILFAVPESALNIRTNRINISSEVGYFVNRKLAVRGFGNWQYTFSGLDSLDQLTTPELILTHERLLKVGYWHAGGGASYNVTPKTSIFVDVASFVTGTVTHYGMGLSVGISRSFNLKTPHRSQLSEPSNANRRSRN
jgi:hypothetical protein